MSTTDTKINIRIDQKTKREAQKTLESLGLDLSSGVKLFLRSVITTQSIPFEVITKNGYTRKQELEILRESQQALIDFQSGKEKSYSSAEDITASLI